VPASALTASRMNDPLKLKAVLSTLRLSRTVAERPTFAFRVAMRSRSIGRYHLAGSDVVIHLRHGPVDMITLEEIFRLGHYDPPTEAASILETAGRPLRVVDLGANIGLFGALIRRTYPSAQMVAFEPDPANARLLRRSIEANGGQDRWRLVEACAAPEDGMVPFVSNEDTSSRMEAGADAKTMVRAVDVFPFLEDVDLLKIDIEGAEWPILTDPRFGAGVAKTLALEYHPYGSPEPDAGALALRLLREAGYETQVTDFGLPSGHGMLWAWRGA
jgi:FkbM family methyltransferase